MSGPGIKPNYLKPGTVIGAYRVEEQIGGGGFGFVYQVERDGRPYALKIGQARLSDLPGDERAATVERLEREVAALMSLHHPNIVRVHSFERWPDLEGGFPYLVMDYVEGTPLQEWRAGAGPSLARIAGIFEKVAGALDHMHQVGIIHRDLKSQNIVVRLDGEPIIVDFGIARPLLAHDVTRAAGVGTLTHLAPEYAKYLDSAEVRRGSPFDWRPTTDLYAFGYVLYEALTGEPPVPRFAECGAREESELLNAIKNTVPRRPRELQPRMPLVVEDLVMQLLEKDPRKRPQSAGEVLSRLRGAREVGERNQDPAWVDPLDIPAGAAGNPRLPPAPAGDVNVIEPLDAPDEPGPKALAARKGPAAAPPGAEAHPALPKPPAPPPASTPRAVALPTAARAPAYVGDDEAPTAEPAVKAPEGWGRESQILRRVAAEWVAASPQPRRWRLLLAAAAGTLGLLVLVMAAWQGASDRPRPQTLLSSAEPGGNLAAPPPLPAPPVTQRADTPAEPAEPSGAPAEPRRPAPRPAAGAGPRTSPNPGARVIDEDLAREYGRPTVLPDGRLLARPEVAVAEPGGLLRSRPLGAEPSGLLRSRPIELEAAPSPPATRGVAFGSHILARLLTNLDSRTIGSGPVEAMLHVPFIVRGQVLLPARTMVYGTATESGGRFTIRFTRMRLPDDAEVAFEGIALARDDGKPGLAASGRIGQESKQGEGLGTKVAKGTGNILLDTVSGGIGHDIVRGAGQAALNHDDPPPVSSQWALLLDAGVVFDVFVEKSF